MAPEAEHQQEQSSSKQRLLEEVTPIHLTLRTTRVISPWELFGSHPHSRRAHSGLLGELWTHSFQILDPSLNLVTQLCLLISFSIAGTLSGTKCSFIHSTIYQQACGRLLRLIPHMKEGDNKTTKN